MVIAALLVPATTWWVSARHYNERMEAESQQQLARLREIQEKYAGIVKENELLKEAMKDKNKRAALFKSLGEGSTEFVLEAKKRDTWNGPTDPDHVWHDQRSRASELLIKLDATEQEAATRSPVPLRRVPGR